MSDPEADLSRQLKVKSTHEDTALELTADYQSSLNQACTITHDTCLNKMFYRSSISILLQTILLWLITEYQ